jgi:hypothetical protein
LEEGVLGEQWAVFLQVIDLTEVELNDLKRVGKDIAGLLEQRLKAAVDVKGKVLIVPDTVNGRKVGVKDLKVHVKHALHSLGLSEEYRVLAEHHKVRIVKVEEKVRYVGKEGTPPAAAKSLPYFFP